MSSQSSDDQCPICLEVYNTKHTIPYLIYPCGHTFCEACLNTLASQNLCPNCRGPLTDKIKNRSVLNLVINNKPFQLTRAMFREADDELLDTFEETVKRIDELQSQLSSATSLS